MASMLFLNYTKEQLKLQYLYKTTHLATKLKTVLSFLEEEGIAVTTTKPRYESSRECIENHRRESSEQKYSKY